MFIIFYGWLAVFAIFGYLLFYAFKLAFYVLYWSLCLFFGALALIGIGTGEIIRHHRNKRLAEIKTERVFTTIAMMALHEVRSGSETLWQTRSTELAASDPRYASWLLINTESLSDSVAKAAGDPTYEAAVEDLNLYSDYDYAYWVGICTGKTPIALPDYPSPGSGPRDWSPTR